MSNKIDFKIDYDSARAICGKSEQAMVYGFKNCRYDEVGKLLEQKGGPLRRVFDWGLGDFTTDFYLERTLEWRSIERLKFTPSGNEKRDIARQCKTGLTNLVLENYKRAKIGLPVIPLLFILDIDNNPKSYDIAKVLDKKNRAITHKELRRMYKLACEFDNEEIRKIAKETFKFAKMTQTGENSYRLDAMDAPWDSTNWAELWQKRKAQKTPTDFEKFSWREELASRIAYHNKNIIGKLRHNAENLVSSVFDKFLDQLASSIQIPIYG